MPELAGGHRQRQGAGSLLGLEVEQGAGGEEGPSKSTREFGLLLKLLKLSVEGRRGIVMRVLRESPSSGRGKTEGGSWVIVTGVQHKHGCWQTEEGPLHLCSMWGLMVEGLRGPCRPA